MRERFHRIVLEKKEVNVQHLAARGKDMSQGSIHITGVFRDVPERIRLHQKVVAKVTFPQATKEIRGHRALRM
nr:unnamed protein product [Callosobruchus analis]